MININSYVERFIIFKLKIINLINNELLKIRN